ncbi:carbohydrate porin [Novosphingobium sp.]|uniref:carbohydrate porin n=1 Tax=Novosphingobium sp. TaxID=1874826 RepID=UPI0025E1D260|nr:carbohydrate porin [Novosphingobium sp.]
MAQEVASDEAPVADRQADVPKPWQPLADDGVTLALSYTGEAATNVTGGLRRDAAYAGQIYVGADLDMDRIAGIGGGTIHAAITNRHGESLSALALGNNTSVQEIWGTQNTHLAILTWEQKLFNDRLMIEAGRSQANIHFLNSPIYCNFQGNSGCGNPTFVFKNSNFTYFPASSWMIRAKAEVLPHVTVHVGAYEVNPDRKRASDHGFNFSTKNATGVIVPWELGYSNEGKGVRLPGHYIIGGWFDRGDYADPLRDDQGGIAILTGRDPQTRKGRSGLYFRFDQRLTRPDPRSERGLSVFGVAMTNLSGRVEESRFLDFGVVQTGTLAGRDADTIGFMISDQRFSNLAMERMRAARVSAGGDAAVSRHQYMMELAYGAQLGPAIRISPNVQYILHPDQTGAPFRTRDIKDALIFGFKFTIDAPTLLSGGR